jgi:hypothetical protein
MIANVLKVNPGRDGGEPGPLLPDSFPGPHGIAAQFVDMPVVRRRNNASVCTCCRATDPVGLNPVQPQRTVRTVRFADPIREVNNRRFLERRFQIVRKHVLPANLAHENRITRAVPQNCTSRNWLLAQLDPPSKTEPKGIGDFGRRLTFTVVQNSRSPSVVT